MDSSQEGNNTFTFGDLVQDRDFREAVAVRQLESIADSLQEIARVLGFVSNIVDGRINVNVKPWDA